MKSKLLRIISVSFFSLILAACSQKENTQQNQPAVPSENQPALSMNDQNIETNVEAVKAKAVATYDQAKVNAADKLTEASNSLSGMAEGLKAKAKDTLADGGNSIQGAMAVLGQKSESGIPALLGSETSPSVPNTPSVTALPGTESSTALPTVPSVPSIAGTESSQKLVAQEKQADSALALGLSGLKSNLDSAAADTEKKVNQLANSGQPS